MNKSNLGFDSRPIKEARFLKSEKQKKKKRKMLSIILIVFLIFMLILGVGSYILIKYLAKKAEESTKERLSEVSNSDWQNEWQQIAEGIDKDIVNKRLEEVRGGEGDTLSDGEISMLLNLVERKEEINTEKARDGYEFVVLDLIIRNQGYDEVLFYNSNFILRDARYTEYNLKAIESSEINLLKGMQNIPAQGEIGGSVIYEVQKGVGALEFLYTGEKKLVFEIEPNL